jgi:hypothetical protein
MKRTITERYVGGKLVDRVTVEEVDDPPVGNGYNINVYSSASDPAALAEEIGWELRMRGGNTPT